MRTELTDSILRTRSGQEADSILRNCVHCGFCNATCPTYQLTGNELDGPRGRIYLIKQVLEGKQPTDKTLLHLDRCLTCRACETTCPSGVDYHRLLDTGRERVEKAVRRPLHQRLSRKLLRSVLPKQKRFLPLLRTGQLFRPLLPAALKRSVPEKTATTDFHTATHARKVLLPEGCVQPGMAPQFNLAAKRVLDALGIEVTSRSTAGGCCGALSHHLGATEEAKDFIRANIDAWWPDVESGIEAIVMTASGCGPMVKDYGQLMRDDPGYADKAQRTSELARDISEVISNCDLSVIGNNIDSNRRVAFHSPCTLQHGQQLNGVVESILARLGFQLTAVNDSHLCCGSAGTYSLLQPALSGELRRRKVASLEDGEPDIIATANIGCWSHMRGHTRTPVVHWIELLTPNNPEERP